MQQEINYKVATARTEKVLHTKASVQIAINDKKLAKSIKAELKGSPIVENNFRLKDERWDKIAKTNFEASTEVHRQIEVNYLKSHDAPKAVVAKAEEKLANKIPVQHGYQGEVKLGCPVPYGIWVKKSKADHKDASCMLTACLEDETWRENPKEEDTERGYFGIPTLASQFDRLASDISYAKKQREKPQSFVGEYEFLSNMYLCSVIIKTKDGDEMVFPSAENAFQAMKCKTRKEMEIFQNITPYEAKKLGKEVDLRSNWNEIRDKVMLAILRAKFEDQELAIELLRTDDMFLCEKNFWGDTYWGKAPVEITHYYIDGTEVDAQTYAKAFRSDKPVACRKTVEKKIKGENKLGKLLCQVRQEIKDSHVYDLYLTGYAEQADINVEWLGRC